MKYFTLIPFYYQRPLIPPNRLQLDDINKGMTIIYRMGYDVIKIELGKDEMKECDSMVHSHCWKEGIVFRQFLQEKSIELIESEESSKLVFHCQQKI